MWGGYEVYQHARDAILEQDNLVYLQPMDFQNTFAITMTENYAKEQVLQSISDLHKVQSSAVAGFSLEFKDREDGDIGLQKLYGLHLDVKTMEPALRYEAIKNSGENTFAHAEGVACILAHIGSAANLQAAAYLAYAVEHLSRPQELIE